MDLEAVRLRGRSHFELRWQLFVLELIYVMLELFTARFFSKYPALSKPVIPVLPRPEPTLTVFDSPLGLLSVSAH